MENVVALQGQEIYLIRYATASYAQRAAARKKAGRAEFRDTDYLAVNKQGDVLYIEWRD